MRAGQPSCGSLRETERPDSSAPVVDPAIVGDSSTVPDAAVHSDAAVPSDGAVANECPPPTGPGTTHQSVNAVAPASQFVANTTIANSASFGEAPMPPSMGQPSWLNPLNASPARSIGSPLRCVVVRCVVVR